MPIKLSFLRIKFLHIFLIAYLLYFFLGLINSGMIIFSQNGLFGSWNNFLTIYNPIRQINSESYFSYYFILMACSSLLLWTNNKISYLWLWLNWTFIISLIPFYIPPPNIGYLGFLFLCLTQINFKNQNWSNFFKNSLWWVLGLSYTASGLGKFFSPTWYSGATLNTVINSLIGQENIITNLIIKHPELGLILSFFALSAEIFSAPLMIFKKTRFLGWLMMTFTHIGILILFNIQDIPLGLLIFHIFMFDDHWFKPKKSPNIEVTGKNYFATLLQKEDIFNIIKFKDSNEGFMVYYNGKSMSKIRGILIALSYSNGFWSWIRLLGLERNYVHK